MFQVLIRCVGAAPSQLATVVLGFQKTHGGSLTHSIDTKQNLVGIGEYEVPKQNIRDETERISNSVSDW